MADISLPTIIDNETLAPLHLDDHEVADAISSGKASFLKGDKIPVIDPRGYRVTIPAEQATEAFSQGYKFEPLSSQRDRADQNEYGEGTGNELRAGLEGAARGATLGASDLAMTKLGVDPEGIKQREERNPTAATVGNIAGSVAPAFLTGGESTLAKAAEYTPAGLAQKLGSAVTGSVAKSVGSEGAQSLAKKALLTGIAHGAGSAVEGAAFGAGNIVSEASLGDPDMNAQKVMSEVGLGALLGGGFGGTLGAGGVGLGKYLEAAHPEAAAIEKSALRDTVADDAARLGSASDPDATLVNGPGAPTNLDDLKQRVADSKYQGHSLELPMKQEINNAVEKLPDLEHKPHALQLEALDSPGNYDAYRSARELPTEEGKALQGYEGLQKKELLAKAKSEIQKVAEGPVTGDAYKAGQNVVDAFNKNYDLEKKELAPLFKKFDDAAVAKISDPQEIVSALQKAIPSIEDHLTVAPEGVSLAKYSPTMGIGRKVYGSIKDVVDAVNNPHLTIGELRSVREAISDNMGSALSSAPKELAQVGAIKRELMTYIGDQIQKIEPEMNVRDTFKRYAINEQERQVVEKIFGGKIGDRASFGRELKPENVLDGIFKNSQTVQAAKQILDPKDFHQALGDYLAHHMEKFSDKGSFSSQKFSTFLKNNATEFGFAFGDKPQSLERIKAMTDLMRMLPDSPSVNPSGSAKSLLHMLTKIGDIAKNPHGELAGGLLQKFTGGMERRGVINRANEIMSGGSAKPGPSVAARAKMAQYLSLKNVESMAGNASRGIQNAVRAFVKSELVPHAAVASSANYLSQNKLDSDKGERSKRDRNEFFGKRFAEVSQAVSNPEVLAQRIGDNVAKLHEAAPNTAQALTTAAIQAAQFLYNKAPKDTNAGYSLNLTQRKWQPSDSEVSKWERYVSAVDHPLGVLKDLKNGVLSSEGVETLKTVYPKLYSEAVQQMTEHLTDLKTELPYQKRLQLSTFFGVPVDAATDPKFITSMQALHAAAGQKSQNQGSGISLGGVSKMKIADGAQSGTERILNRT